MLGANQLGAALRLLLVAIAILVISQVLESLLSTSKLTQLFGRASDLEHEEIDALLESLRFYTQLFSAVSAVGSVLAAVALFSISRASSLPGTRRFAAAGALAFAIYALLLASVLAAPQTGESWFIYSKPWTLLIIVTPGLGFAACLVCATRIARQAGKTLPPLLVVPAALWIAWDAGWPLYRYLGEVRIDMSHQSPWLYAGLMSGIMMVGTALLAFAVLRAASAVGGSGTAESDERWAGSTGGLSPEGWREAASGLKLYGDALAWRLAITVGAYLLLFVAVSAKSVGLAKLVGWLLPLAAVITGLVMIAGVVRYSRQPDNSPARSAAYAAFVFMVIGAALECYGLVLTLKVLTANSSSWDAVRSAREAAESAQSLSVWAMIVAFCALVALLISFRQVADHVGDRRLAARVITVAVLLVSAAGIAVWFRTYIQDAKIELGGAAVLAVSVLGYTLVAVIAYISLTRALERSIRAAAAGAPSELPGARIVRG